MNIQNVYDEPTFFEGYKNLRKNSLGFNSILEEPYLRSLAGNLAGKIILDIGCGFGDFCRYTAVQGANKVIGLDPSQKMIQDAQSETDNPRVQYVCAPIETYQTDAAQFDLIVSSLAFHYVEDFNSVIQKIHAWLKPNGLLVFSVEHPICTAQHSGPAFNYRDRVRLKQKWFIEGVEKYHRTVSDYINALLENGFRINQVLEPMPTDAEIQANPHLSMHRSRPPLLIISNSKN